MILIVTQNKILGGWCSSSNGAVSTPRENDLYDTPLFIGRSQCLCLRYPVLEAMPSYGIKMDENICNFSKWFVDEQRRA